MKRFRCNIKLIVCCSERMIAFENMKLINKHDKSFYSHLFKHLICFHVLFLLEMQILHFKYCRRLRLLSVSVSVCVCL